MEKSICLIDAEQHATILASLRLYQALRMGSDCDRSDAIAKIATNAGQLIALDDAGIDLLVEKLQLDADPVKILSVMKSRGAEFDSCIQVFGVDANSDPYSKKACEYLLGGDDHEVDEKTVISHSDGGAWVMSWLYITNEEAGVFPYAELLESLLDHAAPSIKNGFDSVGGKQPPLNIYADWLEDLITNYADELDQIETCTPTGEGREISWEDAESLRIFRFYPSKAVEALLQVAFNNGLPESQRQQVETFLTKHGSTLDAVLTVIQTA